MNKKEDFDNQEIDPDVIYVTCKYLSAKTGRSRGSVWRDIKIGKLRAIWGSVLTDSHCRGKKCSKPNRAWLVHPSDACQYVRTHKKPLEHDAQGV